MQNFRIFYAPDDPGQGGGELTGDGGTSPDMGGDPSDGGQLDPGASGGEPEQILFETTDEKGNPVKFRSKEELAEAWKKSGMLRSDYTRKTQSLAEERKKFEAEMEKQRQEFEKQKEQIEKYNNFLRQRPDIAKALREKMQNPDHNTAFLKAQEYVDQNTSSLKQELEELKQWRAQQEAERQRKAIFEEMKGQYSDFDEAKVQELLNTINPQDPRGLVELLYHASVGRESPAQIEQRLAEGQRKKKQGQLLPGSGSPSAGGSGVHSSFDEAEAAARKNL